MEDALIGYTGFVGSTLLKQHYFRHKFRSINIPKIVGHEFNLVVCAAAPAQKWVANQNPVADHNNIENLISYISRIRCSKFVLISTVDVFKDPVNVNEDDDVDEVGLHPYGLNRRHLEKFVEKNFSKHLIVRLPGLVGPGLRKNIIFDFLNQNNLDAIDSRGVFQFYPTVNLWFDIQLALKLDLKLLHLTSAPLSVNEIALAGFGKYINHSLNNLLPLYDFQSNYARLFGGESFYQYSRREVIQAVRAYAQSEPMTLALKNQGIR